MNSERLSPLGSMSTADKGEGPSESLRMRRNWHRIENINTMKSTLEEQVIEALGGSLKPWAKRCHEASIALVNAGVGTRVARGWCDGILGQHSWVVMGEDCYSPKLIIDATRWSYTQPKKPEVQLRLGGEQHHPHGEGSIWDFGKPPSATGRPIRLSGLSSEAKEFMRMCGPLDRMGWAFLANAPVQGWPSKEIIAKMATHPKLSTLVPIDIIGMLTTLNPGKLYLPSK